MSRNTIIFKPIYRGDFKVFEFNFKDGKNSPIELTGRTIYMTFKRSKYDLDSQAIKQKVWYLTSNPNKGNFVATLSSSDTLAMEEGMCYADIRVSYVSAPKQIYLTLEGTITVEQPITLDILKEE